MKKSQSLLRCKTSLPSGNYLLVVGFDCDLLQAKNMIIFLFHKLYSD